MGRSVIVWSLQNDRERYWKGTKKGSYSRYQEPMWLHLAVWKTLVNRIEHVIRDGLHTRLLAGEAELERWLCVASDRH